MNTTRERATAADSATPEQTKPRRIGRAFVSLAFILGAVFLGFSWWLAAFSGKVTIHQIIINAQGAGGEGAGGTDLVLAGIFWIAVVPLTAAPLLLIGIRKALASDWRMSLPRVAQLGVTAGLVALLVGVPVGGATAISNSLSLPEYVDSLITDHDLGEYYRVPEIEAESEGQPPNLVLVYLESVEDAFSNTTMFEKDMLAPLTEATEDWESLELTQPANGGWTLGGIINTQCGFPLRMVNADLIGNEINEAGRGVETYLPGATCLGDVLEEEGYQSVFMGGANTNFAGKGTFLADHGYGVVLGRTEWQAEGETEFRKDWGLSDRRLIELAKERVTELHESGQPFNLTVLTLDPHANDYVHPYCDVTTEQELTSIYDCSMQQVAELVEYMDEQNYLEDTVVVVMGDHLRQMGRNNTFRDQLAHYEETHERTIFNRIWVPEGVEVAVPEIDQLSMYPTILELLGYELADGRAGVGVSALEPSPGPDSVRELSQDDVDHLVNSLSQDFYDEMWGVEHVEEPARDGGGMPDADGLPDAGPTPYAP